MEIHAIKFKKSKNNLDDIINFFNKYDNLKPNLKGSYPTKNFYHINITPKTRYKNFITKKSNKKGINIILGIK